MNEFRGTRRFSLSHTHTHMVCLVVLVVIFKKILYWLNRIRWNVAVFALKNFFNNFFVHKLFSTLGDYSFEVEAQSERERGRWGEKRRKKIRMKKNKKMQKIRKVYGDLANRKRQLLKRRRDIYREWKNGCYANNLFG